MDFILDVYVGWCLFFCFSLEIGCTGMKSEILSIKIKCIKNREKEKWKMKDKIFGVLQRIGRSFYASDRDSSGSRSAAGNWKFFYE